MDLDPWAFYRQFLFGPRELESFPHKMLDPETSRKCSTIFRRILQARQVCDQHSKVNLALLGRIQMAKITLQQLGDNLPLLHQHESQLAQLFYQKQLEQNQLYQYQCELNNNKLDLQKAAEELEEQIGLEYEKELKQLEEQMKLAPEVANYSPQNTTFRLQLEKQHLETSDQLDEQEKELRQISYKHQSLYQDQLDIHQSLQGVQQRLQNMEYTQQRTQLQLNFHKLQIAQNRQFFFGDNHDGDDNNNVGGDNSGLPPNAGAGNGGLPPNVGAGNGGLASDELTEQEYLLFPKVSPGTDTVASAYDESSRNDNNNLTDKDRRKFLFHLNTIVYLLNGKFTGITVEKYILHALPRPLDTYRIFPVLDPDDNTNVVNIYQQYTNTLSIKERDTLQEISSTERDGNPKMTNIPVLAITLLHLALKLNIPLIIAFLLDPHCTNNYHFQLLVQYSTYLISIFQLFPQHDLDIQLDWNLKGLLRPQNIKNHELFSLLLTHCPEMKERAQLHHERYLLQREWTMLQRSRDSWFFELQSERGDDTAKAAMKAAKEAADIATLEALVIDESLTKMLANAEKRAKGAAKRAKKAAEEAAAKPMTFQERYRRDLWNNQRNNILPPNPQFDIPKPLQIPRREEQEIIQNISEFEQFFQPKQSSQFQSTGNNNNNNNNKLVNNDNSSLRDPNFNPTSRPELDIHQIDIRHQQQRGQRPQNIWPSNKSTTISCHSQPTLGKSPQGKSGVKNDKNDKNLLKLQKAKFVENQQWEKKYLSRQPNLKPKRINVLLSQFSTQHQTRYIKNNMKNDTKNKKKQYLFNINTSVYIVLRRWIRYLQRYQLLLLPQIQTQNKRISNLNQPIPFIETPNQYEQRLKVLLHNFKFKNNKIQWLRKQQRIQFKIQQEQEQLQYNARFQQQEERQPPQRQQQQQQQYQLYPHPQIRVCPYLAGLFPPSTPFIPIVSTCMSLSDLGSAPTLYIFEQHGFTISYADLQFLPSEQYHSTATNLFNTIMDITTLKTAPIYDDYNNQNSIGDLKNNNIGNDDDDDGDDDDNADEYGPPRIDLYRPIPVNPFYQSNSELLYFFYDLCGGSDENNFLLCTGSGNYNRVQYTPKFHKNEFIMNPINTYQEVSHRLASKCITCCEEYPFFTNQPSRLVKSLLKNSNFTAWQFCILNNIIPQEDICFDFLHYMSYFLSSTTTSCPIRSSEYLKMFNMILTLSINYKEPNYEVRNTIIQRYAKIFFHLVKIAFKNYNFSLNNLSTLHSLYIRSTDPSQSAPGSSQQLIEFPSPPPNQQQQQQQKHFPMQYFLTSNIFQFVSQPTLNNPQPSTSYNFNLQLFNHFNSGYNRRKREIRCENWLDWVLSQNHRSNNPLYNNQLRYINFNMVCNGWPLTPDRYRDTGPFFTVFLLDWKQEYCSKYTIHHQDVITTTNSADRVLEIPTNIIPAAETSKKTKASPSDLFDSMFPNFVANRLKILNQNNPSVDQITNLSDSSVSKGINGTQSQSKTKTSQLKQQPLDITPHLNSKLKSKKSIFGDFNTYGNNLTVSHLINCCGVRLFISKIPLIFIFMSYCKGSFEKSSRNDNVIADSRSRHISIICQRSSRWPIENQLNLNSVIRFPTYPAESYAPHYSSNPSSVWKSIYQPLQQSSLVGSSTPTSSLLPPPPVPNTRNSIKHYRTLTVLQCAVHSDTDPEPIIDLFIISLLNKNDHIIHQKNYL